MEEELLNEWKQRLGLQDWLIKLETKIDPKDMTLQNADGTVVYEEAIKAALIQTIDPDKHLDTTEEYVRLRPFDFEATLVHELLHIKFCLLEKGTNWEKKCHLRVLHQIIDDIARALIDAKRSNNEK